MCNFLSAIVLRNSDIICMPEYTDSHEDLIEWKGLSDKGQDFFVRVEFYPENRQYDKLEEYKLQVDQSFTPKWFNDELKNRVKERLQAKIQRMIISYNRKILLGGCFILTNNIIIDRAVNTRIKAMYGSSQVNEMNDSSQVNEMYDSSQVNKMYDSSQVNEMYDSSQVNKMCNSSQVNKMCNSSQQ